jgi:hypothetical protein
MKDKILKLITEAFLKIKDDSYELGRCQLQWEIDKKNGVKQNLDEQIDKIFDLSRYTRDRRLTIVDDILQIIKSNELR